MKHILFLLLILPVLVQSQDSIHNKNKNTYLPFEDIVEHYRSLNTVDNQDAELNIYSAANGYKTIVKYAGESRPISDLKLEVLSRLFKATGIDIDVKNYFKSEVLVTVQELNYWLPIQKSLETFWLEEVNKGQKTMVNIRAYGSQKSLKEDMWLFTINSFRSDYYNGLWDAALESSKNNNDNNFFNCVDELIRIDPKDGRNYFMKGYYFYDKGYPNNRDLLLKADSLYSKGIELSPKYSYGYYQIALVRIQLGNYVMAWDAIKKAEELGETNTEDFIIQRLESKLPYEKYLKSKQ